MSEASAFKSSKVAPSCCTLSVTHSKQQQQPAVVLALMLRLCRYKLICYTCAVQYPDNTSAASAVGHRAALQVMMCASQAYYSTTTGVLHRGVNACANSGARYSTSTTTR
eukprot:19183-Heterococcus_DN1.PRE.4